MKHFFTLALIAGGLMLSAPSQARMVSSRAQCVAACDGNGSVSDNCSWITKRAKWTRCRAKLLQKCRRFGADAMCPAPPPPTTTTVPPLPTSTTTTTTVPFVPPTTTTTLPALPPLGPWSGDWHFVGTLYDTDCPTGVDVGYGLQDTFHVEQRGTYFTATRTSVPGLVMVGDIDPDGGFTVVGDFTLGTCQFRVVLATTPTGTVILNTEPAGVGIGTACSTYSCTTEYLGSMSR